MKLSNPFASGRSGIAAPVDKVQVNRFAPSFLVKHPFRSALAAAVLTASCGVLAASLEESISAGVERAEKAASQQEAIDEVDSKTKKIQRQYRQVSKQVEGLETYISQMEKQILSQQQELGLIDASIQQVAVMQRQITPLMLTMLKSLEEFVALDVPFLTEERQQRVARLAEMMDRGDVTVAEKYRALLEAYQTEVEYGRTIEAYRDELDLAGQKKEVDVLRVGRIALMYQSLDGQSVGAWNREAGTWEQLPGSYKSRIQKGIRIARQQAAPALIAIPAGPVQASKGGVR